MERPSFRHPDGLPFNAAYIDLVTRTNVNVECAESLENAGHSFTTNGDVLVLAGHKPQSKYPEGRRGLRILNMTSAVLQDAGSQLQYGHWLATATQLPNGMITVMGDSPSPVGPDELGPTNLGAVVRNAFYEVWDPSNATKPTLVIQMSPAFMKHTKSVLYPFVFVLPTGDMFVWSNTYGEIIAPLTGRTVAVLPNWSALAPRMMTQYPFSGSAVMLPLTPENNYMPEVIIFGGQWSFGGINTSAVNLSMRLRVNATADGGVSTGDGWQMEEMPSPRVSHSSVLLPNGKVILIGGAKAGLLGDAAAGGVAMLNDPNFWPVLYSPSAPEGVRYETLARSQIARLLHSTAGLTTNGTIFVAGSDRSARFWSTANYSECPTSFTEYRVEIFSPPFVLGADYATVHPTILDAPAELRFGATASINFSILDARANVTSAVLVAPSSDTHTFNMHQRLVGLAILSTTTDGESGVRSITVRGPPNANIAPPGMYMLFLLNGDVYGPAKWIKVL
ncbi:hypothetical protein FOA52_006935 [Chlamydomonas sp. UWO 241]|nr:hypothetical protein FOA52_006935 [Chlamydomonas sp. UWO 241]